VVKLGKVKKPGIVIDDNEQNENEDENDLESDMITG
jgi:hypothetical protein